MRAEVGFRRWEENRSAGNFVGVVLALLGLATLDFIILLPFLCGLAAIFFGLSVACLGCVVGGTFLLFNLLWGGVMGNAAMQLLIGLGLISGAIGGGALLLLDHGSARQAFDPLCPAAFPPVRYRQRIPLKENRHAQARSRRSHRPDRFGRLHRRRRRHRRTATLPTIWIFRCSAIVRAANVVPGATATSRDMDWDGSDHVTLSVGGHATYTPGTDNKVHLSGDPQTLAHIRIQRRQYRAGLQRLASRQRQI